MSKLNTHVIPSEIPCPTCGGLQIYHANRLCVFCSRRRSNERTDDNARKREGLKPTVAGGRRELRRNLLAADRVLREAAECDQASRYSSLRACQRGHRNPERYVSTGGCVLCAALSSRRSYSKIRK